MGGGGLDPLPTPKLEDNLLSAVRSYPPYLEAVSSIRNLGRAVTW
jgi:hypothetical protein